MNVRENLKAYLDRELPEDQAAAVRQALEQDPSLRQELEEMRMLGLEIRRAATEPEPVGMEQTIGRIAAPRRPWARRPLLALSGIAALAVLVSMVSVLNRARGDSPMAESSAGADVAMKSVTGFQLGIPDSESRAAGADVAMKSVAPMAGSMAEAPGRAAGENPDYAMAGAFPERMVVRTADIRLKVDDAAAAMQKAIELAKSLGGYAASSGISRETERSTPVGTATLRVPERNFDAALGQLRTFGDVLSENSNSDDVTLQHADVSARLKVLRAEEQQYVTLLGAAKTIGQVLQVRERLNQVRQEIESLDAQRKTLERQAALSTITVTFVQRTAVGEPEPGRGWASEAWASAVNGLTAAFRWIGAAAIFLFVYSPLWLPALLLVAYLARRFK